MVDGLAEHLGGRLTLESQPGVGTTANIWIPAVPRTPKSARTGNGATPQPPAVSERVLLTGRGLMVDDAPLVLTNTSGDPGGPLLLGTHGRLRQPGPGDAHGDAGAGHHPHRPRDATGERKPEGGAGRGPGAAAEERPCHRLRGK
ncbi:hypothetical protein ACV354_32235, partial [Pseudomonas aeruginosa]